jgi:Na+-transporting NADH:ubiquinone oxidoreductase subunit C
VSESTSAGAAEKVSRWLGPILALPNDSTKKTLLVALALSLVCSLLVSASAVVLQPLQAANAALDRQRNILAAADLLEEGADIEALFAQIERRIVELASGEFSDDVDPQSFDQRRAARDPDMSVPIPRDQDVAGIGRRSRYASVYLVTDGDAVKQIILPIHGYGLWSTLYGFIALEADINTVVGLKYYEHAETAGLGAEVDNPAWLARWRGKLVFDASGKPVLEVVKGAVTATGDAAKHQVDGLAGATLTANGVTNMLHYWLGEEAFGPFLARIRKELASS